MDYKNRNFELTDEQVNDLMRYAPAFSQESSENIKTRFYSKTTNKRNYVSIRKIVIAAVLTASILSISVLAYAGILDLSRIYKLVFGDNGEYISQYGTILDGGNESNGIKLDLISTIKDDTKLLVFFTLTDLTESSRLGERMEIRDWHLDQGHGGNCSLVGFDEDTQTASFMITSIGASTNKMASLTIKSFLESLEFKSNLEEKEINITSLLSEHNAKTIPFRKVRGNGISGGFSPESKYNYRDGSLNKLNMLLQDELSIPLSWIDYAVITNMGFVDNEFHIQTKRKSDSFSDVMSIDLVDEHGNVAFESETSIGYGDHEYISMTGRSAYDEFIFQNIHSVSQLEGLTMSIGVAEYGAYHTGEWKADFKVPDKMSKLVLPVNRTLIISGQETYVEDMTVSPLGISITYKSNNLPPHELEMRDRAFVTYKDGTVTNMQFVSIGAFDDTQTLEFSNPVLQLEQIAAININGSEIALE